MLINKIKEFQPTNPLEIETKRILLDNVDESNEDCFQEDFEKSGCVGGMISGLIYYKETLKFYKDYIYEINELLNELDVEPNQLKGFDEDDYLINDTTNQNLLAWFGFEETARKILN